MRWLNLAGLARGSAGPIIRADLKYLHAVELFAANVRVKFLLDTGDDAPTVEDSVNGLVLFVSGWTGRRFPLSPSHRLERLLSESCWVDSLKNKNHWEFTSDEN